MVTVDADDQVHVAGVVLPCAVGVGVLVAGRGGHGGGNVRAPVLDGMQETGNGKELGLQSSRGGHKKCDAFNKTQENAGSIVGTTS